MRGGGGKSMLGGTTWHITDASQYKGRELGLGLGLGLRW
jgi:hypothetical protein